jgi:hypothetical protein
MKLSFYLQNVILIKSIGCFIYEMRFRLNEIFILFMKCVFR